MFIDFWADELPHVCIVGISDKWNGQLNLESVSVRFLTFGVVTRISTKSDNDRYIGAVRDSRANQPEFVRSRALIYLSEISLSINYQPNAYTSAGTVNLLSEFFNLGRFHTSAFLASP